MSGTGTPNLDLKYLDTSQAQPEVKINDAWNKIDEAVGLGIGISVSDVSTSPPIVHQAREIKFMGATVTHETGGVARVEIDGGGSGGGGSIEVTDGTTTVSGVTEIHFTNGAAVSDAGGGIAEVYVDPVSGGGGSVGYPGTVADLVYWFKADEPLVSSGNLLDVLPNATPWNPGQVAPRISGTGASRSGTSLNSLGVFTFPGNSEYVLNAGPILGKVTAFFVYKPATVTANCTFVGGIATNCLGYYTDTNGKQSLVATGTAVVGVSSTALTLSTWAQGNVTYNASTGAYAYRLNRATDGSGTSAQTISGVSLGIGSDNSGASPLNGDLAEFILYKRVLSGTEITNVENYLNAKWGV